MIKVIQQTGFVLSVVVFGLGCRTIASPGAQVLDDDKIHAGANQQQLTGYYQLSRISGQINAISNQANLILHIESSGKTGWNLTVMEAGETSNGRSDLFEMKKSANQPKCPGCYRFEGHQLSATILTDVKKRTISFGSDGQSAYFLMVPAIGFKPSDFTSVYGCYSAKLKFKSESQDERIKSLAKASSICINLRGSDDAMIFGFKHGDAQLKVLNFNPSKSVAGCQRSEDCYILEEVNSASPAKIRMDLKSFEQNQPAKLMLSSEDDQIIFNIEKSEEPITSK